MGEIPVGYWSTQELSKLASVIGKPLYTDLFITEMDRIFYARVLVETDIAHPLPSCIEIHTPSGVIHQDIDYDWKPKYCVDFAKFGHAPDEC